LITSSYPSVWKGIIQTSTTAKCALRHFVRTKYFVYSH